MRRPKQPEPPPDPLLPHGAEGPSAREEPEEEQVSRRQFVRMPPTSGKMVTGSAPSAELMEAVERYVQPAAGGKFTTANGPQYRLRSTSEVLFPELFEPGSSKFWHGLSDDQQLELTRMQAAAMERVGFEPGTKKYFIDVEEDDTDLRSVLGQKPQVEDKDIGELGGGGNWLGGGVLLGAGLAALCLGLSPLLNEEAARLHSLLTFSGMGGMLMGGLLAAIKTGSSQTKKF